MVHCCPALPRTSEVLAAIHRALGFVVEQGRALLVSLQVSSFFWTRLKARSYVGAVGAAMLDSPEAWCIRQMSFISLERGRLPAVYPPEHQLHNSNEDPPNMGVSGQDAKTWLEYRSWFIVSHQLLKERSRARRRPTFTTLFEQKRSLGREDNPHLDLKTHLNQTINSTSYLNLCSPQAA